MKLALTFTENNPYSRCGIFIKHASPKVWLTEMKRMQLKLSDCIVYPCPGLEANSISGVLLIFKTAQNKIDVDANVCIQKVHTNFYIPENTQLNMALTNEEYDKLLNGKPHFFHHEFGMIELTEELRWETILNPPIAQFPVIETPAKGVKIPTEVKAFSIEIEEAEEEDALGNPFGDKNIDPEDMPFDMKKVLQGNNIEVEKYLTYLEKNPDAALKMAIPLDMMGTSRGKAYAKYKFKSNFFESLGFGNASDSTKSKGKTILGILAVIFIFWLGYEVVHNIKQRQIEVVVGETNFSSDTEEKPLQEDIVIASDDPDTETTRHDNRNTTSNKLKETPPSAVNMLLKSFGIAVVFVIFFILIGYFVMSRKESATKRKVTKNKSPSWLDLPEDNELFSFNEEEKTKENSFYFGGDELSLKNKIIIIIAIVGLLIYLFYPMLKLKKIGIFFVILAGFLVLRLLYILLNKNKTFVDENT